MDAARSFVDADAAPGARETAAEEYVAATATSAASLPPHRRRGLYLLRSLRGASRRFVLNRSLLLNLRFEGDQFFATHPDFDIDGYGTSEDSAVRAFEEMFDVLWSTLFDDANAELTPQAAALAQRLREMVSHVDPRR